MSNEISATASLSVIKGGVNEALTLSSRLTFTGTNFSKKTQVVPTTAGGTALDVAGLGSLGMAFFKNNDAANAVDIMTGVSGTLMATVPPGMAVLIYFPAGVTAPAAIAHTASVQLEQLILEQ